MGELRRKERSQLGCTAALEGSEECSPKGGAEDSGAPLLGRQYPIRLSRSYAGMKIVEHDARTLPVSWVAGGATQHRRTYLASGSILLARLTPASATQPVECTAADFAIGALPEGRGDADRDIARSTSDDRTSAEAGLIDRNAAGTTGCAHICMCLCRPLFERHMILADYQRSIRQICRSPYIETTTSLRFVGMTDIARYRRHHWSLEHAY